VCQLCNVPVNPTVLERISVNDGDPEKHSIITTAAGSKFAAHEYYGAIPAVITAEQAKTLIEAKEAEALRMGYHFRVLTVDKLREAVSLRVAQAT
jgi:hypothetical protein